MWLQGRISEKIVVKAEHHSQKDPIPVIICPTLLKGALEQSF